MAFEFDNYSNADKEIIKEQLNSKEVFISGICERCIYGFPQVIFLNPVKEVDGRNYLNYEAISNIIWLTCPYLNDRIHELENKSYIKKIQKIIQEDTMFRELMVKAHANYFFIRNIVFRKYTGSMLETENIDLSKSGIGGIRDLSMIKCLHLHFCHYYVCKDNIAGRITLHYLDHKTYCDNKYCEKFVKEPA
jgi:uncharacterized protein